jgi:hypothetical protein
VKTEAEIREAVDLLLWGMATSAPDAPGRRTVEAQWFALAWALGGSDASDMRPFLDRLAAVRAARRHAQPTKE